MVTLTKSDEAVLQELGLKGCPGIKECEAIIDSFRMRQLDKLKMILSKLAGEGHFSYEIREGIRKNDLSAFARAVLVLNSKSLENAN